MSVAVSLLVLQAALASSSTLPYDEAKEGATETRGDHLGSGEWMLGAGVGISPMTLSGTPADMFGLTIRAEYQSEWRVWGWLGGNASFGLTSMPVSFLRLSIGSYFAAFAEAGLTVHWSEHMESEVGVSLGMGVGRAGTRFSFAGSFGERVSYLSWRFAEGQKIEFLRLDVFLGSFSDQPGFFALTAGPAYSIRF